MKFESPIFLFICFIIFLILKFVRESKRRKTQRLPPGPTKLPLLGNLLSLAGSLPQHALRELARTYGPIMYLHLGQTPVVVISSACVAKEVMKTHDLAISNRPKLLALEIIAYNYAGMGFAPYGEFWRQMRKICTLELLSAKKVREFRSIREVEVYRLMDTVQSCVGLQINLTKEVLSMTNAITCRAALGKRCKDERRLIQLMQETTSLAGGFDVADLFPSMKILRDLTGMKRKLTKIRNKIDSILDSIISERLEKLRNTKNEEGETGEEFMLDVLLRIKETGGLEFPITLSTVKATMLETFLGGTDTSSSVIEWAMSEMLRNPQVMAKAQAEIREKFKGKKILSESDIQGLTYLEMVIKETLRLHPPLPLLLPRESRLLYEINGYTIPTKTKIIVNAVAINRDPEYWENAERFVPERFENNSVDFRGTNFEYITFGAGRRICPGISFGLANVELALAQLLYHFNWELPGGMNPEDLDMNESSGSTASRRSNLYVIPTRQF